MRGIRGVRMRIPGCIPGIGIIVILRDHTDDHFFDTFSSRTCHGHPLPCNASGVCVSQEDADTVFALGDWEYK